MENNPWMEEANEGMVFLSPERPSHYMRSALGRAGWAGSLLIALVTAHGKPPAAAAAPAYQYEVLALLGARAPGGGALRGGFEPAAVSEQSDVAYIAGVGSRGARGLFLDTLADVVPIVSPGQDAAEGWRFAEQPGALGGIAAPVAVSAAGDIAFAADLTRDDQRGSGVFRWARETRTLVAVALPRAPAPGEAVFGDARAGVAFDALGAVLFSASLQPPEGATDGPAEGLFRFSAGGEIGSLILPGDPEPGGGRFVRAGRPSANRAGQIAFEAEVARNGQRRAGIFLAEGARLRSVVEAGALLPGGDLLRAMREPHLNERGDVLFLGDAGEWAVYLARAGTLTRLVGPGSALPDGKRVGQVVAGPASLSVAPGGQAALVLRPEDQPESAGVYLSGPGGLTAVALPGTFLAGVGPIDAVGEAVALNDGGQVAFQAELADGDIALVLATPVPSGG
jgi:hypothetical protein